MRAHTRAARPALLPALLALPVMLTVGLTAGCGSSDTYNPTVPGGAVPDFTLSVSPTSRTIEWGQTADYQVTVRSVDGFDSAVSLVVAGLPTQTVGTFSPASVTPTVVGATSKLTVRTNVSTPDSRGGIPTGTHTLTITGTGGGKTHSVSVTLVLTAPPDFTISVSPSSVTVPRGQTAHYTVTLTAAASTTSAVGLTISGLPANTTATFDPASLVPAVGGATSTLDVHTTTPNGSSGTPLGTFTLTVTGTGVGNAHSATTSLVVGTGQGSLNGTIQ